MGLLGNYNETMYPYHFSKSFNWLRRNVLLVTTFSTKERWQRAIDKDRFELVQEDKEESTKTWTAVVWSKSLKHKIRTVYLEKLHWLSKSKEQRQEFSMATIKNYYRNRLFLKSVFKALDIDPNQQEINQKLYFFGKKAA